MPRFTEAYSDLMTRLLEISTIQRMAQEIASRPLFPQNNLKVNSLFRGGVVLLSSHIEGYIEELGEIALEQIYVRSVPKKKLGCIFKYHLSKDLINDIKNVSNDDPAKIVSKFEIIFERDKYIWDSTPTYSNRLPVDLFIGDFSNPVHEKIRKFLNRFGFTDFDGQLAAKLRINHPIYVNMINNIVELRNSIAHGDQTVTGTPNDLNNMIRISKLYCRATDSVVGNWFRSIGCPIR